MSELIKIREVSLKYDISARALKYYEDMGLLQSNKSDDYAYRLYDEEAIKRLEQILVLRKLNIKIKDIQRIFKSNNSDIVLEVLNQKVTNIDAEVALLQELKEIVLDFIKQIETLDFKKESDIKLLYEKVKDVEQHIVNVGYEGNTSNVNRLIEITEKLDKLTDVRIIKLPSMRVLSSYTKESGGIVSDMEKYIPCCEKYELGPNQGQRNYFAFRNPHVADHFEIVEIVKIPNDFDNNTPCIDYVFEGGLFAVTCGLDDKTGENLNMLFKWLDNNSQYEVDYLENGMIRQEPMGENITPYDLQVSTGHSQLDLYVPIRLRNKD